MCILSGCDYLQSLKGIGLRKAFKFFNRKTQDDINVVISVYLLILVQVIEFFINIYSFFVKFLVA